MKSKLNYMSQRQGVLAQNIANADTPGYRAQEVAAPDFRKMLYTNNAGTAKKLKLAATHQNHIHSANEIGAFRVTERKTTGELNPNGNNVVIEEEIARAGQNQAEYQTVLNLYSKAVTMFKTALGKPSGGA